MPVHRKRSRDEEELEVEDGLISIGREEQQFIRRILYCPRNSKSDVESGSSFNVKIEFDSEKVPLGLMRSTFESMDIYKKFFTKCLIAETLTSISTNQRIEDREGEVEERQDSSHRRGVINVCKDGRSGRVIAVYPVSKPPSFRRPICILTVQPNATKGGRLSEGSVVLLYCQGWSKVALGVVVGKEVIPTVGSEVNIVCYLGFRGVGRVLPNTLVGAALKVYYIDNVVSALRESRAIANLSRLDILGTPNGSTMARATPAIALTKPASMIPDMWRTITTCYNADQVLAIQTVCGAGARSTSSDPSIVLIQGPPGTGKTLTILGIISAVLVGCADGPGTSRPLMPGSSVAALTGHSGGVFSREMGARSPQNRIRVVVCAPSNTAVDEILLRILTGGLIGFDGHKRSSLKLVRVGRGSQKKTADSDLAGEMKIKKFTLDELVKNHPDKTRGPYGPNHEELKRRVLEEAEIFFCTFSTCGQQVLDFLHQKVDVLILDEAAQAVEPSTLIATRFAPRVTVLVGDAMQLRPTVTSKMALEAGYSVSLFERLSGAGFPTLMLKQQYRMRPEILAFPSFHFYENLLTSSGKCITRSLEMCKTRKFGHLVVHNIKGAQGSVGKSFVNKTEALYVIMLLREIFTKYPTEMNDENRTVGVIVPYAAMCEELLRLLGNELTGGHFNEKQLEKIQISTIDGFQGREKDIVIVSCVRASRTENGCTAGDGIGFFGDKNRINVALTRARTALWVVGDFTFLSNKSSIWRAFYQNAVANKCVLNAKA